MTDVQDLEAPQLERADRLLDIAIPLFQTAMSTEGLRLLNGGDLEKVAEGAIKAAAALELASLERVALEGLPEPTPQG